MLPILNTARLWLRPAGEEDLDELWQLWANPQVRQFLWDDVLIDRERARETIHEFGALGAAGLGLWTMAQCEEPSSIVGCAALTKVGPAARYYPPIAGAIEPLISRNLPLERLVAVTDVPNAASDRLLQRAGFVLRATSDGPRYRLRHYTFE